MSLTLKRITFFVEDLPAMGPVTEVSDSVVKIRGKDPEKNMIEIYAKQ